MGNVVQDARYALRTLMRSRGFALVAVLTLALGIGANAAIFSVLDAVLLRPLPYRDPERLVMLWTDSPARGLHEERSSLANVRDWSRQSESLEGLAAFDPISTTLTGDQPAEQISVARVSASFFSILGVSPALGRTFTAEEDAARESVVVLSHGLWQHRLGGSAEVLGEVIEIDGRPAHVIGVMPESFAFPDPGTDLWEPHTLFPDWEAQRQRRGVDSWLVLGRLKPGVSLPRAQAEMDAITRGLAEAHPRRNAGLGVSLVPLDVQVTGERLRAGLWMLFGAVVLVLLIACTNVANLLLARSAARERELAIRTALGADRGRIVRQLLTEAAVLSLLAGLVALLLAVAAIDALVAFGPGDIPRLGEVRLDGRVLAFTSGASLLVAVLFGTAPAWRAARRDPNPALKEGGRGAASGLAPRRVAEALVIGEFALAVVLATGAGLFVRSLLHVQAVDPGFRSEDVLMMQLSMPRLRTEEQRIAFCRQALERLEAIPGVAAAGAINDFFIPSRPVRTVFLEGDSGPSRGEEGDAAQLTSESVAGRYFESVGLPLLSGRRFNEFDGADAPAVAVINRTMARRFWPDRQAVGERFQVGVAGAAGARSAEGDLPWITVVGVVGDARRQGLEQSPIAQVYRPYAQDPSRLMSLLIRADADPAGLVPAVRRQIGELDPSVPLYHVSTVAERLRESLARRRFQSWVLGLFALLALALAATGIYGLMHQSVSRRTHEIGVRMALGAPREAVLSAVLKHALGLALVGVALGTLFAAGLATALSRLLFQVKAIDPVTFAGGALSLMGVALLASYLPARRATRIDPIAALRDE
jgi:putative ABC transport system permease protein